MNSEKLDEKFIEKYFVSIKNKGLTKNLHEFTLSPYKFQGYDLIKNPEKLSEDKIAEITPDKMIESYENEF